MIPTFRGKIKDSNRGWVIGCLVNNIWKYSSTGEDEAVIIPDDFGKHGYHMVDSWYDVAEIIDLDFEVDPKTIGMSTGLKDKNGKDAFDGDFVKDKYGTIYKIVWNQEDCAFYLSLGNGKATCFDLHKYLIVGNIHDNPELLERKSDD